MELSSKLSSKLSSSKLSSSKLSSSKLSSKLFSSKLSSTLFSNGLSSKKLSSKLSYEESVVLPLTPNSKRSGGARQTVNISAEVHSPDADSNHYHPYRRPPLFEDRHFFERFSNRLSSEPSQAVSRKVVESYLRHVDVHYKEAVRETLRMDYYSGLWRHEAARRLCAFQGSLNSERKSQFRKAEHEARWLLNILVERDAMSAAITDVQYLAAARDDNARALSMADVELDILKGETQNHDGISDASRVVHTYLPDYSHLRQSSMMLPAAASDGEVPLGNDWEDSDLNSNGGFPIPYYNQEVRGGHYLNPYINPYYLLHREPSPHVQLDTYLDDPPHRDEARIPPYPPMPSYDGMDHPQIQQDSRDLVPCANPVLQSPLPLTQPNLGDFHPTFSLPVTSGDGFFALPSEAHSTMPANLKISESQAGPSRTAKRRLPKRYRDDPFINYSSAPSSWKGKKKASNLKPLFSHEPPSTHSIATESPLPPASGSTLAAAALPPMVYDQTNLVHQQIVDAAQQSILNHAINVCSMLVDSDLKLLVREILAKAASIHCHNQKFGEDWAGANLEVLFARLSAPFELIPAICKITARSKVERGYRLRPSAWSSDSESNRKKHRVEDLVDDHTSPLKFIFRKDEETDKMWPLEHEVVWDTVITVISELKLQLDQITNLDNLFCTAAAAVHCALCELRSGKMVDIVFSAFTYRYLYDQLMDYIKKDITLDLELAKRWNNFKACTITRLEDIN
ncbi:hypothetical protein EDD22DRAFT_843815 [Suillus occidentalis]|nr:hypothetical protein EDD22DRAFT_843815 [Suillus occidentalis]